MTLKYNFSSPGFDGGLQQQFLLAIFRIKVTHRHNFAKYVIIIITIIIIMVLSPSSLLASAVHNKYRRVVELRNTNKCKTDEFWNSVMLANCATQKW